MNPKIRLNITFTRPILMTPVSCTHRCEIVERHCLDWGCQIQRGSFKVTNSGLWHRIVSYAYTDNSENMLPTISKTSSFNHEDGGSMYLRNDGIHLQNGMVSLSWRILSQVSDSLPAVIWRRTVGIAQLV